MSSQGKTTFGLIVATVIGLLYAAGHILTDDVLFFRDHTYSYRGLLHLVIEELGAGRWPLWNAYHGGGEPLAASPATLLYSPLMLVFALPGSFDQLYDVFVLSHFVLAGAGAAYLARVLGARPAGQVASGAAYLLCGVFVSFNSLLPLMSAAAWAPFALGAALRLSWAPSVRRLVVLAPLLALHVYGADPSMLLCDLVIFWALGGTKKVEPTSRLVRVAWLVAGAAIAAGLLAVQLLPLFEWIQGSLRSGKIDIFELQNYAAHPAHLLELIFPGINGNPYIGGTHFSIREDGKLYLPSLYFGTASMALLAGIMARKGGWKLGVAAAFSMLMAVGDNTFVHALAVNTVPGLSSSRFPIKYMYAMGLIVPVAWALAFTAQPWTAKAKKIVAAAAGVMLVVALALSVAPEALLAWAQKKDTLAADVSGSASQVLLTAILLLGLTRWWVKSADNLKPLLAMAFLMIFESAFSARLHLPAIPGEALNPPPSLAVVKSGQEPSPGVYLEQHFRMRTDMHEAAVSMYTWDRLVSISGPRFRIRHVFDPDLNAFRAPRWQKQGTQFVRAQGSEKMLHLGRLGVQYYLTHRPDLQGPLIESLGSTPLRFAEEKLHIYRIHPSRPEVSFSPRLSRDVLPSTATVAVTFLAPTEVQTSVISETKGFVLVAGRQGEGWFAEVNGEPAEVKEHSGLLQAVAVPAGESQVRLYYEPGSFALGKSITWSSVAVLLGLLVIWSRRRRMRKDGA